MKRVFQSLVPMFLTLMAVACTALPKPAEPLQTAEPATPGQPTRPGQPKELAKVLQSQAQRVANPNVPDADLQSLADGNTSFALDFYQAVRGQSGNLFYSPYSLSLALAMVYGGARGETAGQLADTLHFTLPPEQLHPAFNALDQDLNAAAGQPSGGQYGQLFELSIANSLWGQKDYAFLPEFLDLLAQNYGAGMRLVDYKQNAEAARQEINGWVSRETRERIQNLIPPNGVDALTRLALVNAIYFKADWLQPFEPNYTHDLPFNLLDGGTVQAKGMSFKHATRLYYLDGRGFQAVDLPYMGDTVSMLVVVPDAGQLDAFEAGLTADRFQSIRSGLQPATVALTLPKFQFTSSYSLADTLKGMGLPAAFAAGVADLSGMDGTKDLYISQVYHKAFVAVDEKGTEAAAATAVVVELASAMLQDEVVPLVVDRPFVFFIYDHATGSILFAGRVVDPTQ